MEIRWDWLEPLLTVPYVPTLGPAHPAAVTRRLFTEVIGIAGTGQFLPHDKDRRWSSHKTEYVLAGSVIQEPGLILLASLSIRKGIKIHVYSQEPGSVQIHAGDLGRQLCRQHGVEYGRLVWFLPPGSAPGTTDSCTRIQMHTFSSRRESGPVPDVELLRDASGPTRAMFSVFAGRQTNEGMAFLDEHMQEHRTGPVIVSRRHDKIIGAIGPMEIMPDSLGAARLLPQYFGVLPEYRGLGIGRRLWRAAVRWGEQHQAAYQLVQTQVGGASDCLFRAEGLTDLGLVCSSIL